MDTNRSSSPRPKKHFWNKKQKKLTVDDITVIDNDMLKTRCRCRRIGNAMEWFDFGVYSYLAVIIGKVFFPDANTAIQLIRDLWYLCSGVFSPPTGRSGIRSAG